MKERDSLKDPQCWHWAGDSIAASVEGGIQLSPNRAEPTNQEPRSSGVQSSPLDGTCVEGGLVAGYVWADQQSNS